MKKTLAALSLTLALLTAPAAAFSDVDEGLYYAAPIAWAVEQGITTGTTETTFSPEAPCTQGQILTFLWRAAGSPPSESDFPPGMISEPLSPSFQTAVAWAFESGIVGQTDLSAPVIPSAACDRGTAMSFLWRYVGSPASGAPTAFTDVPPDADYAQAVAWAVEAGITEGTTETTFSPGETCTRGQIAAFLYRCLGDAASAPEKPEDPPAAPEPALKTDGGDDSPLRTLTGQGRAYSLGLDGSEFTSDGVYDAEVTVDVYSPTEAVFTIRIPFPLFQACRYTVRFEDPNFLGTGYNFSHIRWDEAFADLIPWEGEHSAYVLTDMSGQAINTPFTIVESNDDRTEGVVSWRVKLENDPDFHFDLLTGYRLSCEVNRNL